MENDAREAIENHTESLESGQAYLYVIHATGTAFVKIGHATDVQRRLKELQPGCPHLLAILYAVAREDAPALEQLMHEHFASYHVHGEWFALPQDIPTTLSLLGYIYRQAGMRDPEPIFDPSTRGIMASRIIQALEEHGMLSVASLADILDIEPGNTFHVQLHRLYKNGLIGKTARGLYHFLGAENSLTKE